MDVNPMEEGDLSNLSIFDLQRLAGLKRYLLAEAVSGGAEDEASKLRRDIDRLETWLMLKSGGQMIEEEVDESTEDGSEEEDYYDEEDHDEELERAQQRLMEQHINQLQRSGPIVTTAEASQSSHPQEVKVRLMGVDRDGLVNLEDRSVSHVGVVVHAGGMDQYDGSGSFLLVKQKLSPACNALFDALEGYVGQGDRGGSKDAVQMAVSRLGGEDKLLVKKTMSSEHYKALKRVLQPSQQWGGRGLQEQYEEGLLRNWQASPPWRSNRLGIPVMSVLADATLWETAAATFREHCTLSMYDPMLTCIGVLECPQWSESGKAIFFVFHWKDAVSLLQKKLEEKSEAIKWTTSILSAGDAMHALANSSSKQAVLLQKAGNMMGLEDALDGSKSAESVGFILTGIVPLLHSAPPAHLLPIVPLLPQGIGAAIERHAKSQAEGRTSALTKATDPGEGLFAYLQQLQHSQPTALREVQREMLKIKGFQNGINRSSIEGMIRGDPNASDVVYLFVNSETGKEYVGAHPDSLYKGVKQLFKSAFMINLATHYPSTNREMHHAIRLSQAKDWRVVILEQNVAPEDFAEKVKYHMSNYQTMWPSGYN